MNIVLLSVRGAETIRKGFIFFLPLEGMFLSHPVRVIKLSSCVETQLEESYGICCWLAFWKKIRSNSFVILSDTK